MKLYRAGALPNLRSTTLFHALAYLGYEALIITSPAETYVSVGYFDRTPEIIDLKKCAERGIPVIRREVGGGAVLLDPYQVFYQVIVSRRSRKLPFKIEDAYKLLSEPVIRAYRRMGVDVLYRPVSDIAVRSNGRKIGGQGAGDIGSCFVFVGGILLRFDTKLMAELFKVPEESFRERLRTSLEENLSWVERETGRLPTYGEVEDILVEEFSNLFDLEEEEIPREAISLADELKRKFTSRKTLLEDTGRRYRAVKIREGVFLRSGVHKTEKGVIKVEVSVREGRVEKVVISGDFELGDLADALVGVSFERESIKEKLEEFVRKNKDGTPGVEDLLRAIYGD